MFNYKVTYYINEQKFIKIIQAPRMINAVGMAHSLFGNRVTNVEEIL